MASSQSIHGTQEQLENGGAGDGLDLRPSTNNTEMLSLDSTGEVMAHNAGGNPPEEQQRQRQRQHEYNTTTPTNEANNIISEFVGTDKLPDPLAIDVDPLSHFPLANGIDDPGVVITNVSFVKWAILCSIFLFVLYKNESHEC